MQPGCARAAFPGFFGAWGRGFHEMAVVVGRTPVVPSGCPG